MRLPIYMILVPTLASVAGFAFAQDTPPATPQQPTESAAPAKAGKVSKGQTDGTAGQAAERLPETKTQTYSGTLIDASCAGAGSSATTSTSTSSTSSMGNTAAQMGSSSSADRSASGQTASGSSPSSTAGTRDQTASSADRSAAGGQSCTVSASTNQFALKMKDGTTVRFDDVGNTRVQEAMKTHKSWSDSATAGKPLRVKASGVLNGDKLTVLSVN